MASNGNPSAPAGNGPPPKPWELASSSSSGSLPFRPPSNGSTSAIVEASGTAKPGEVVATGTTAPNQQSIARFAQQRPWEQGYGTGTYNSGFGSGMYGVGNSYGGLYGNGMYRGGYGPYGGSMYGGGMYGSGYGAPMGGYGGMGMGGPYGNQEPPPSPPGFWVSFLRVMEGVVSFFGRIAMLIDQNTQAFHMFMSALLQLFDRSGMLYGELARFVLRILGIRAKPRKPSQVAGHGEMPGMVGPPSMAVGKVAPATGAWDGVWGDEKAK